MTNILKKKGKINNAQKRENSNETESGKNKKWDMQRTGKNGKNAKRISKEQIKNVEK